MQIASVRDLLPTLTELAGVKDKSKKAIDGKSLKTLLSGNTTGWKSRTLVSTWKGKLGVRDQRFRLGYKGKLFDMENDPGQRVDVSKQFPKVTERLNQRKQSFQNKVLDKAGPDTRPFVIGHPGVSWTQIPARDGTAHGGIKRSNKFPNCSYFLNWTSKEDFITWDVEVGESGRYEVELWYACSKKDLGSEIELSLNGESVLTTITKPNDPPLVGMKEDRSPRSESYAKDFRPMKMGTITLQKGKGELKLQAKNITGSQAMEFRLLMLQRIEAK